MRSTKVLLMALGVMALCLTALPARVLADETAVKDFLADRDAAVSSAYREGSWDERYGNGGAAGIDRAAKRSENFGIFDWDFDAIKAWIASENVPADYYPVFTLTIRPRPFGTIPLPQDVWVNTLNCENDWAEGDGTNCMGKFNWSSTNEPAVTSEYAQTYYLEQFDGTATVKVLDTDRSVPWVPIYGVFAGTTTNFNRNVREPHHVQPRFINSEMFHLTADDAEQKVSVQLDYGLMDDLMNNPRSPSSWITGSWTT